MALRATVLVGKNGVTENILKEAVDQVKKSGLVKIRFNGPKEDLALFEEGMQGKATLVMKVGKTLVYRKRR